MMLMTAFLVAMAADTTTFLLLPPGGEANPLVIGLGPMAAIALRWVAALVLLLVSAWLRPRARDLMFTVGIMAASVGAGSNLSVLVR